MRDCILAGDIERSKKEIAGLTLAEAQLQAIAFREKEGTSDRSYRQTIEALLKNVETGKHLLIEAYPLLSSCALKLIALEHSVSDTKLSEFDSLISKMTSHIGDLADLIKKYKGGSNDVIEIYRRKSYHAPEPILSEAEIERKSKAEKQKMSLKLITNAVIEALNLSQNNPNLTIQELETATIMKDEVAGLSEISSQIGIGKPNLLAYTVFVATNGLYNLSDPHNPYSVIGELNDALAIQDPKMIAYAANLFKEENEQLQRIVAFAAKHSVNKNDVKVKNVLLLQSKVDNLAELFISECDYVLVDPRKGHDGTQTLKDYASALKHIEDELVIKEGVFMIDDIMRGTSNLNCLPRTIL